MGEPVEVELPSGNTMWVMVESGEEAVDVGLGDRLADLPGLPEIVEWVTSNVTAGLRNAKPDGVTVEVNVELSVGNKGLVAALGGAGAKTAMKVTFTWGQGLPAKPVEPPADEPR
ncbi:CU044_2847 family protein [Actinoplanes subglobosus]|uniref:CU044_2847 family protein n=1 Tax=Actinoplanes subglobosus TaxID=1547892 RepID=A0ABV8IH23_9ACTN